MLFSFGVELKTLTLVVFLCYRNVLFFLCPFPNHIPLRVLYLLKLLNILLVHQHLNSLLPFDLCSTLVFKRIDHLYPTRSQNLALLKLPYANTTTHGLKRLSSQAILQWNSFLKFCPQLADLPLNRVQTIAKSFFITHYT